MTERNEQDRAAMFDDDELSSDELEGASGGHLNAYCPSNTCNTVAGCGATPGTTKPPAQ